MQNKSECEIVGIGVLKGEQMALCDMECVSLKTNAIKILEIRLSFTSKVLSTVASQFIW